MLLEKGPWSDSLGALVHGRGFYDQFDSDFWENKYRWCFDGDGGDGGDGGADDADSMDSGTGPGNDGLGGGPSGGPSGSADDADSMDSGTGPGNDGLGGGPSGGPSGGFGGGFGDVSPGYGGPGVEGDLGSPGIDASPGYGGPGVEGPASLGYGFGPAMAEEPGVFGSIRDAVLGPPEFDPSKNFAYAKEYGMPEETSLFDMAVNTVLGSPVSMAVGTVLGGPLGLGLGALANYAVEEAFGPSVATDTFGNTLGISSNNAGLGSAAMDAVGIGSLSDSLGSFSSSSSETSGPGVGGAPDSSFSSSSSETSGPGVGGAPDSSDLGSPAGGDYAFLNQPLGLAALSPSTVLGVADTTSLNDVTPSWSPANFQQYSGIGGLRNV